MQHERKVRRFASYSLVNTTQLLSILHLQYNASDDRSAWEEPKDNPARNDFLRLIRRRTSAPNKEWINPKTKSRTVHKWGNTAVLCHATCSIDIVN